MLLISKNCAKTTFCDTVFRSAFLLTKQDLTDKLQWHRGANEQDKCDSRQERKTITEHAK